MIHRQGLALCVIIVNLSLCYFKYFSFVEGRTGIYNAGWDIFQRL